MATPLKNSYVRSCMNRVIVDIKTLIHLNTHDMKSAIIDQLAKLPKMGLGGWSIRPFISRIVGLNLDRVIDDSDLYALNFNPNQNKWLDATRHPAWRGAWQHRLQSHSSSKPLGAQNLPSISKRIGLSNSYPHCHLLKFDWISYQAYPACHVALEDPLEFGKMI